MKYLLFVYPSEDTWDENVSNSKMVSELATVTQSDEIKYFYGKSHTLFQFDSPLSPWELADFVTLLK